MSIESLIPVLGTFVGEWIIGEGLGGVGIVCTVCAYACTYVRENVKSRTWRSENVRFVYDV